LLRLHARVLCHFFPARDCGGNVVPERRGRAGRRLGTLLGELRLHARFGQDLHEHGVEPVDDREWRAARHDDAVHELTSKRG